MVLFIDLEFIFYKVCVFPIGPHSIEMQTLNHSLKVAILKVC